MTPGQLSNIAFQALCDGEPAEVCDAKAHAAARAYMEEIGLLPSKQPVSRYWHMENL